MTTGARGGLAGPVSGGPGIRRDRPEPARSDPPDDPALLRDLLDGVPDGVIGLDAEGRVSLLNPAAAELLPGVAVGDDLAVGAPEALRAAVASGAETFDTEHRGRRLRGRRRRGDDGRSAWYVRDVTEAWARTDALLTERSHSAFLAEVGARLGASPHHGQTLRTAVTTAVPVLADAAVVIRRPTEPSAEALHWVRYADSDRQPVSGTSTAALADAVPGLADALDGDPTEASPWLSAELANLAAVLPADFGRPGTVLVTPMPGAGGPAGALVAVRRPGRAGFDGREIALVREFATRVGAALATAELYAEQSQLAGVLQAGLRPPELPAVAGAELAGGYRAASDSLRIGGDFYEVRPHTGGADFALGDVCGKGIEAAVLSGRVRQSLHTLRLVERRPLPLVELLNDALLDASDAARRSQFTTLLVGTLAPAPAGGLLVRMAGGGHPAPLVVRPDGTVTPARVGGMPVGALAAARFAETELRLAPGELLLIHTDGVTEARGGPTGAEMFGDERLRRALTSCAGLPAPVAVDRLLQIVDEWLDGRGHDDIAMLAVRAGPTVGCRDGDPAGPGPR